MENFKDYRDYMKYIVNNYMIFSTTLDREIEKKLLVYRGKNVNGDCFRLLSNIEFNIKVHTPININFSFKKEAEELVNEIKNKTDISRFEAIECAKILCEKIIHVISDLHNLNDERKGFKYWIEINKELYKIK